MPAKAAKLEHLLANHRFNVTDETVRLVARADDGVELTFNLSEPRNHSYVVNGIIVRNCSEYMHIDNSACNLASINLLKYLGDDGTFDVEAYKHTVEVMFTAQEILVGNADYPTEKIAENSRKFRQLGLGYANLGALLMAQGMPYDSDGGRAWAAALTALMTGHAYATSARTAGRMGPFAGYDENARRHEQRAAHAPRRGGQDRRRPRAAGAARRRAAGVGRSRRARRDASACATRRPPCSHRRVVSSAARWCRPSAGLVRLGSLGDPIGDQWQPLGIDVQTDEGPREATQFYVNGVEPVVDVESKRGYRSAAPPSTASRWSTRRAVGLASPRRRASRRPCAAVVASAGG